MMRILFLFVVFTAFSFVGHSQEKEKTEVMQKMMELRNGLINGDSAVLGKLFADDVTYGHTNGLIQTKAQMIKDVVTKVQNYKAIDPSNLNVRIYGNTSVVNMQAHINLIYHDQPLDLDMYIVLVWIKNKGDWKLVARQSVSVKK